MPGIFSAEALPLRMWYEMSGGHQCQCHLHHFHHQYHLQHHLQQLEYLELIFMEHHTCQCFTHYLTDVSQKHHDRLWCYFQCTEEEAEHGTLGSHSKSGWSHMLIYAKPGMGAWVLCFHSRWRQKWSLIGQLISRSIESNSNPCAVTSHIPNAGDQEWSKKEKQALSVGQHWKQGLVLPSRQTVLGVKWGYWESKEDFSNWRLDRS